jgi:hypothetical protein
MFENQIHMKIKLRKSESEKNVPYYSCRGLALIRDSTTTVEAH